MSMKKLLVVLGLATVLVGAGLMFLTDLLRFPDAAGPDPDEPVAAFVEPTSEEKTPIVPPPVLPRTGVTGTVYFEDSLAPASDIHVAAIADGSRTHAQLTTTDEDGTYVLSHLEPGQYWISAWRGEWTTRWSPDDVVDVRAKKLTEGIDITLVPGVVIQGQVLEERTGRAIEDANVSVHFRFATTDEEGRFSLEGVSEGLVHVIAKADSFARRWSLMDVAHGEEPFTTVALSPAGILEGRVTTADGKPAPQVEISAGARTSSGSTRSDTEGRYRIDGLSLAHHSISVTASRDGAFVTQNRIPGFTSGETRLSFDIQLDDQLDDRRTLHVQVVDKSGVPLAGATLHVSRRKRSRKPIESDEEGRFIIEDATDRPFWLTARKEGYAPASIKLSALAHRSRESITLVLESGHFVAGIVLDTDGNPIEDASVVVEPATRGAGPAEWVSTDESGRFRVEDLPRELERIGASKTGWSPGLLVNVRYGESTPLEHASVRLIPQGYPLYFSASTDASGQAILQNVPTGPYRLEVYSANHSLFDDTLDLSYTLVRRIVSLRLASWLVVHLQGNLNPSRRYSVKATVLAGGDPGWMAMTRGGNQPVAGGDCEVDGHGGLRVRLKTRPGTYRIRFDVGAGRYLNSPTVFSQEREISLPEGREGEVTLFVTDR